MKKSIYLSFLLLLALVIAGCGKQLSKEDVLTKASNASKNLKSYSVEMMVKTETEELTTTVKATGDVTHNPDMAHLNMNIGMSGMSIDIEAYVSNEETYMSMLGEWIKMPSEESEIGSFDQLNEEEINKLLAFKDQFELTEEGNDYVLKLSGNQDGLKEIVDPLMSYSNPLEDFDSVEYTIKNMNYEIRIDKKSFIMATEKLDAELEMDGESIKLNVESKITNVDKVEPIVIPDKVKESATSYEDFEEQIDDINEVEYESASIEEIEEIVGFSVPQITDLPEGFTLLDSYYSEGTPTITIDYEKDDENWLSLEIYLTEEDYGEFDTESVTEVISINGHDAYYYEVDEDIHMITWKQNDMVLELFGFSSELSGEDIIKLAESVK